MDALDALVIGLKVVTIVLSGAAVMGSAAVFVASLRALRAKHRAQKRIHDVLSAEFAPFELKDRSAESLTPQEVDRLSKMIEEAICSMSASDRRLIQQGLHQNSQAGVKNYVLAISAV